MNAYHKRDLPEHLRNYRSLEEESDAVTAAGLCFAGCIMLLILGAISYGLYELGLLIAGVL